MEGHCLKCKCKQPMENIKDKKTSNGRAMKTGTCKNCGTKMSIFVSSNSK